MPANDVTIKSAEWQSGCGGSYRRTVVYCDQRRGSQPQHLHSRSRARRRRAIALWVVYTAAAVTQFGVNGLDFDPLNNGTLLGHGSQWEWTATFPATAFTWAAFCPPVFKARYLSAISKVGSARSPTFGYEDVLGCSYSIATAASPPSGCALPSEGAYGLFYYSGLSIAPGTTFMASKGSDDFGTGFDLSGYSTDGYKTNYLPYNRYWNASVDSGTGVASWRWLESG